MLAPLDRSNVDTDQIIPKQFLKSILRTGFGDSLFFDWRYGPEGDPDPDFELNQPRYAGASILLTRNNFGCGSSREHAVWAILQYGFRAVLAPSKSSDGSILPAFADIFRNNAVKNGLLTLELPEAVVDRLFAAVAATPGLEMEIDLRAGTMTLSDAGETVIPFEVGEETRRILLGGLDEISMAFGIEPEIRAFEKTHDPQTPRARSGSAGEGS
jgi:3-isopropylmalate/(R)-2-methylmalate dehydratase small subunit